MNNTVLNWKIISIILLIGFTFSVCALDRSEFIQTADKTAEFELKELTDPNAVDIGDLIFSWIREYWNGLVNGHNNWKKDYNIGTWCMNKKFQAQIGKGIIIGIFRTITLSYVNLFQLGRDLNIAYDTITSQLVYCKAKNLATKAHSFVFDTNIWVALLSTGTAIVNNFGEFIGSIPIILMNLFYWDLRTIGYVQGKLLVHIFEAADNFWEQ